MFWKWAWRITQARDHLGGMKRMQHFWRWRMNYLHLENTVDHQMYHLSGLGKVTECLSASQFLRPQNENDSHSSQVCRGD